MKLDTQPLLLAAERLALAGFLPLAEFKRRKDTLTAFEGRLVLKEQNVEAFTASRNAVALDGTSWAWERWRAENLLVTLARTEATRLESFIVFEVELLEKAVALALQAKARDVAGRGGEGLRA